MTNPFAKIREAEVSEAELARARNNIFTDFGMEYMESPEEQDRRETESYASYRYAPYWYAEDPGQHWWNADWARRRRYEVEQDQLQNPRPRHAQSPMYVGGRTMRSANPAAGGPTLTLAPSQQAKQASTARAAQGPARPRANRQQATRASAAPAASNSAPSNAPQVPAAQSSNAAPGSQAPVPPQTITPPALPPNLWIPLAQRPQPPFGFNDQPPARMPSNRYLNVTPRPPRNVQWPRGIVISIVEICTFCPDWLQNPQVVARAVRNGWSREALAKAQLRAENALNNRKKYEKRYNTIQKQISEAGKLIDGRPSTDRFSSDDYRKRHGPQNDLTADNWLFKLSYDQSRTAEWLGDIPLSDFWASVSVWPTGNDRLLMTQCLEFARQNPGRQLDTSHWDWIISSQNLTAPPPLPNGQHRDVEALGRVNRLPNPP